MLAMSRLGPPVWAPRFEEEEEEEDDSDADLPEVPRPDGGDEEEE